MPQDNSGLYIPAQNWLQHSDLVLKLVLSFKIAARFDTKQAMKSSKTSRSSSVGYNKRVKTKLQMKEAL